MPARDKFHDLVLRLLVADGWTITHDPYHISVGRKNLFVDIGAEKLVAAEREGKRIAVEAKTFGGSSEIHDLEVALGQYMLYVPFMREEDPERRLYLAIAAEVFKNIFEEPIGRGILNEYKLRILVFDSEKEVIARWTPQP